MKHALRGFAAFLLLAASALRVSAQTTTIEPTGTLTANGQSVVYLTGNLSTRQSDTGGYGAVAIQIDGTYTGTLTFSGSTNCVTYTALNSTPINSSTAVTSVSGGTTGTWQANVSGLQCVKVAATSAMTGTATVTIRGSSAVPPSVLSASISGSNPAASGTGSAVPASASYNGLNIGGTLTGQTGITAGTAQAGAVAIVDGSGNQITSFGGGTQYANGAVQATPTGTTALGFDGANVRALSTTSSGYLNVLFPSTPTVNAAQSGTWNVTNISGTVSLPTGAATAANQSTGNTSLGNIDSATSRLTSSAEGVSPGSVGATTAFMVGGIFNSVAPTFTNGQRGAVQLDASGNLKVNVAAGSASNAAASATGSAVPASAGYTGINIGGNLTGVTGKSVGTEKAVSVAIVDGSGNQISSFGGGTQYTDTSAQATPTGTVALGFDGTNVRALNTNTSGQLNVVFPSTPTVNAAQSGTWNVTNISGTVSLPTGAATAANQTTGNSSLSSIDGKLPATAALANGTANPTLTKVSTFPFVFNGTTWDRWTGAVAQSGTWTVQPGNTANTTPWLVTGKGAQDSAGTDMTDTANHALKVNIVAGAAAGGTSLADGGAFTAGTTSATPLSGFYQSSPTVCTTGTACAVGLTTNREVKTAITTLKDSAGTDMTDTTNHAVKVAIVSDTVGSVTDSEDASVAAGQNNIAVTIPLGYLYNGTAWIRPTSDPCTTEAKVYTPISQATSTQLITGTASKKVYVCGLTLVGADAENVSIVSGTGTVCATGTAAMVGGTTAANGPNLAANGGFVLNNGANAWAVAGANADNVCLLQSGTGRVSGVMVSVVR